MSRRVVLLIALTTLALLATAVAPWTLSRNGIAASVAQQLRKGYGLGLEVRGRSTIALLPIPRVKFEDITLATADSGVSAQGGVLRGELRLLPLLFGRVELAEVALSESRIMVDGEAYRAFDWVQSIAALHERGAKASRVRRLVLTSSSIRWADGWDGALDDVGIVLNWPDPSDKLEVSGWAIWRGERIEVAQAGITPAVLATGRPSPYSITASTPAGRIDAQGEAQVGSDPRVTGQMAIAARSVRDLVRWSGVDLPLGSLVGALSIEGDFSADRRRLTWPSVLVTLGPDSLEGTLSVRFEGERPVVNGTLAANKLDLSEVFAPFLQARTPSGLWNGEEITLARATGGDLDLRLSAMGTKIGRLQLGETAASILVRPGRIEASLGRAGLHDGALKGRLTLTSLGKATEIKAQGTFDKIDLAPTLADLGHPRWITGTAQGQFTLEGSGRTVADLIRQAHGRAGITVKNGELIGIGLAGALRRVEKHPLSASLEWKGGRTSFDQAVVNLNIGAGVGDVMDGALSGPGMRTALEGRVSLIDRSLTMRAKVSPAASDLSSPLLAFDVTGSWDDVEIIPDARALIERSRAAKPLFGLDRVAPSMQGASATPN